MRPTTAEHGVRSRWAKAARLALLGAALAALATPALAQWREGGRGGGRGGAEGRRAGGWEGRGGGWMRGGGGGGGDAWRGARGGRPYGAPPPYRAAPYAPPQPYGGGPYGGGRAWRRGEVLPQDYRGAAVPDPGRYHLRRAPNGYGWVGDARNAYLMQRSTGMVLDSVPGAYEPPPPYRGRRPR